MGIASVRFNVIEGSSFEKWGELLSVGVGFGCQAVHDPLTANKTSAIKRSAITRGFLKPRGDAAILEVLAI